MTWNNRSSRLIAALALLLSLSARVDSAPIKKSRSIALHRVDDDSQFASDAGPTQATQVCAGTTDKSWALCSASCGDAAGPGGNNSYLIRNGDTNDGCYVYDTSLWHDPFAPVIAPAGPVPVFKADPLTPGAGTITNPEAVETVNGIPVPDGMTLAQFTAQTVAKQGVASMLRDPNVQASLLSASQGWWNALGPGFREQYLAQAPAGSDLAVKFAQLAAGQSAAVAPPSASGIPSAVPLLREPDAPTPPQKTNANGTTPTVSGGGPAGTITNPEAVETVNGIPVPAGMTLAQFTAQTVAVQGVASMLRDPNVHASLLSASQGWWNALGPGFREQYLAQAPAGSDLAVKFAQLAAGATAAPASTLAAQPPAVVAPQVLTSPKWPGPKRPVAAADPSTIANPAGVETVNGVPVPAGMTLAQFTALTVAKQGVASMLRDPNTHKALMASSQAWWNALGPDFQAQYLAQAPAGSDLAAKFAQLAAGAAPATP
jgi:hypothetical protein